MSTPAIAGTGLQSPKSPSGFIQTSGSMALGMSLRTSEVVGTGKPQGREESNRKLVDERA
jgi:hypothetical protein